MSKVADVSRPINFQSEKSVSSKMAESVLTVDARGTNWKQSAHNSGAVRSPQPPHVSAWPPACSRFCLPPPSLLPNCKHTYYQSILVCYSSVDPSRTAVTILSLIFPHWQDRYYFTFISPTKLHSRNRPTKSKNSSFFLCLCMAG